MKTNHIRDMTKMLIENLVCTCNSVAFRAFPLRFEQFPLRPERFQSFLLRSDPFRCVPGLPLRFRAFPSYKLP